MSVIRTSFIYNQMMNKKVIKAKQKKNTAKSNNSKTLQEKPNNPKKNANPQHQNLGADPHFEREQIKYNNPVASR